MMYNEDDFLLLSGLQHLRFCPRQCALIHLEQQWKDNYFTAAGEVQHEKVHSGVHESRRTVKIERNLMISSQRLGLIGRTDAVEFHSDGTVMPVEYKHGSQKLGTEDEVQLCAQAICLEEMLNVHINCGAIYYFKTKKRHIVQISKELRAETIELSERFHALINSGITPKAEYSKRCESCSLIDNCCPKMVGKSRSSVKMYLKRYINENN